MRAVQETAHSSVTVLSLTELEIMVNEFGRFESTVQ